MECKTPAAEAAGGPAERRHKQQKEKKLKNRQGNKTYKKHFPGVIKTTVR